jgi:hypothetical protein
MVTKHLIDPAPNIHLARAPHERNLPPRPAKPSAVIPGRRAASSPESITTGRSFVVRPDRFHQNTPSVAMDSGLIATRCPGMTSGKISAAANRSAALFARRANHLRNWRDVRLACPALPIHARLPPKRNAPKNSFRKPAQTDQAIQPGCEKYFAFVFSEIDVS